MNLLIRGIRRFRAQCGGIATNAASRWTAALAPSDGQTLVEYALILVLVSTAAVAIMTLFGTQVSGMFSSVSSKL